MSDDTLRYADMMIEADGVTRLRADDGRRLVRFTTRVLASPAGDMRPEEAATVEYDERELLGVVQRIEARGIDRAGLMAFGQLLATLLLPAAAEGASAGVRELFAASFARANAEGGGLRLRLRLPPPLAALPWEYLYLDRSGGGDAAGFLALDPRIAIVRHEPLAAMLPAAPEPGPLNVVVALASPVDLPPVDLARNRRAIEGALANGAGVEPVYLEDATLEDVRQSIGGAEVFHFTGHGALIERQGADGSVTGVGTIALDDQRVDAELLGANLRGGGVRLAVLGGCETGRRDGVSIWSGVAPGLIKAEVPAVVAYQLPVSEESARHFNAAFYTALVGGMPIEQALAAARLAVFNLDPQGAEWGVALLYLRASDGQLFAGAQVAEMRDQARKTVNASYTLRVKEISGGEIIGVRIGTVSAGGAATVNATASVEAETIIGGSQTGVSIDEV